MEWLRVAREYFPEYPDDLLGYIIWNETGYPEFWNIPQDGDTPRTNRLTKKMEN